MNQGVLGSSLIKMLALLDHDKLIFSEAKGGHQHCNMPFNLKHLLVVSHNTKNSLGLWMNQQYELIRLTDVNSHVLFSVFSLVLKPLHVSKTCLSCHSNSEVGNVACWFHISSHPWSPLSCSDRSLQCVWCTSLHSTVSFGN